MHLFLIIERQGILLLHKNGWWVHCLLVANRRVLLVSRVDLDLRGRWTTLYYYRNSIMASLVPDRSFIIFHSTHCLSFTSAQNRGAVGSMIFLFNAQIESHSRETMACDGPCANMNWEIASTVRPRRRIPMVCQCDFQLTDLRKPRPLTVGKRGSSQP